MANSTLQLCLAPVMSPFAYFLFPSDCMEYGVVAQTWGIILKSNLVLNIKVHSLISVFFGLLFINYDHLSHLSYRVLIQIVYFLFNNSIQFICINLFRAEFSSSFGVMKLTISPFYEMRFHLCY